MSQRKLLLYAKRTQSEKKAKKVAFFQGTVSGIDVIATPKLPVRCLAYIRKNPRDEIQVTTDLQELQSALEAASIKNAKVEVTFEEVGREKKLTRVRLLDR